MRNISNKTVALVTLGSWALILVIAIINGFVYGAPPVDHILPESVRALIGWSSLILTVFSVIKLYMSSDNSGERMM